MLGCALLQHVYREILALLCDVIKVLVKVLKVIGVLFGLEGVVQALLHWVIIINILGKLEGHGAISWTCPGFKQLYLLQVVFVQSSCGVSR